MERNVAALVLAAGKGTRMKSALPKVLHPACGKPLVAWPVEAALAAGADPVVVVVGHGADAVRPLLAQRFPASVRTAVQQQQLGTGHAARVGLEALGEWSGSVLIVYGDCPLLTAESLTSLLELRARTAAPLALWTTRLDEPRGYGRVLRGDDGLPERIVEERDATAEQRRVTETNPGVYAADAAWLRSALARLEPKNAQAELYLTDLVALARADGRSVPALEVGALETMGVNDRAQLGEAAAALQARVVRRAQLDGVTFLSPATVAVDAQVRFGIDVTVGAHAVLTGATALESEVHIGAGCVLHDTTVATGTVVHPYSVCDGARIGKGCVVGPFARLRPGAVLEEGAHVGNFVEMKKARLGRGSKANHLAYLGDADIGAKANIGAGTITCNYDGIGKHRTVIGDEVFVGSNATLVAPVAIARGAYVAAGSTITADVPEDALAIGRGRQQNKAGYAAGIRAKNAERAQKKP
ncbi:MAG: bifunctional UDP-N-acetylglucosamine diphosphorylase/glucosamine-1-phosphate N-acetyltransferase GlmU [Deltaproteobacteria bacterium]|nr:bifunctional UDP-N-acetylglucosamine diphosphorylase/glucosamine-1-phosphate N-acetyltransferase GlmU [Deltaproteobacteria bacterium]